LELYIDLLRDEVEKHQQGASTNTPKYFHEYKENLFAGIEHLRLLAEQFAPEEKATYLAILNGHRTNLDGIVLPTVQ
jgi:hypothetical protein